jgi:hypothetical protein
VAKKEGRLWLDMAGKMAGLGRDDRLLRVPSYSGVHFPSEEAGMVFGDHLRCLSGSDRTILLEGRGSRLAMRPEEPNQASEPTRGTGP